MSDELQETLADIVKELRGIKGGQHTNGGLSFERWLARCQFADDYADRFEVAHRRELAELCGERNGILNANASLASDNDRLRREVAELKRQLKEALAIASDIDKCASIERHTDAMLKKNGVIVGLRKEVAELRECLEQAYGDKIGTYTMKGNEVERWRKALKGASND